MFVDPQREQLNGVLFFLMKEEAASAGWREEGTCLAPLKNGTRVGVVWKRELGVRSQ